MKILESAENYLEAILIIKNRKEKVRAIDIANELGYSKASVSVAMKQLKENGYIQIDENNSIQLLEKGRLIAEAMYERHTVITNGLIKLGVDAQVASEDACRIEHVLSTESFEALKKHFGAL